MNAHIAENLRFLADLAASPDLDPETRAQIGREHAAVAARAASKEVRLAVVGEFSSGKSTFINALLGVRILPEGYVPVTARTTRIAYASRAYGEVVIGGRTERFDLSRLDEFTRDGRVAAEVEDVRVFYPSPLLKEGVVILDTPGDNVKEERHRREMERAIAEANAVAFLIPADRPAQGTGMALLELLKERMGKFFFVLTMADSVDEDELEETVAYVAGEVGRVVGGTPAVYPVSARRVLEGGSLTLPDGTDAWKRLLDALVTGMRRDREWIILGDLLRVQTEAMASVRGLVESRRRLCEAELAELLGRALDVERVRSDLSEQVEQFVAARQQELLAKAHERVPAAVADVRSRLMQVIEKATAPSGLVEEVQATAQREVARTNAEFAQATVREIERAAVIGAQMVNNAFAETFTGLEEASRRLFWRSRTLWLVLLITGLIGGLVGFCGVQVLQRSDLAAVGLGAGALAGGLLGLSLYRLYIRRRYRPPTFRLDPSQLYGRMDSRALMSISGVTSDQTAGLGAKAGLVGGFAIGGPLGALVGGVVGGLLGALFGKDLMQVQDEMRPKVAALASALQQNLIAQQSAFIVKSLDELRRTLEAQADLFFERYGAALTEMVERQSAMARRVRGRKQRLEEMGAALSERLTVLEGLRRQVNEGSARTAAGR